MAMYEHKTTMLGTLFGINAFDQPGVELGKKLANEAYNLSLTPKSLGPQSALGFN